MFATGAMSYLASPLWLGFVLLGVAIALGDGLMPETLPGAALVLSGCTLAMLLMPRVLGVALVIARGEQRSYGGAFKLAAGALLEAVMSVLQAPVRMVAHSIFVLGALTGLKLDWKSPARDASALGWRDAVRCMGGVSLIAMAVLWWVATSDHTALAVRVAPLLAPLALAVPLVVWTSRVGLGRWLRRCGMLLIPEEVSPPTLLGTAALRPVAVPPKTVPTPVAVPVPTPAAATVRAQAPRRPRPAKVLRPGYRLAPMLRAAAAVAGLAVPITAPLVPSAFVTASAPPVHHWAAAAPAVAESLLPPPAWPPFNTATTGRGESDIDVGVSTPERASTKVRSTRRAARPPGATEHTL